MLNKVQTRAISILETSVGVTWSRWLSCPPQPDIQL